MSFFACPQDRTDIALRLREPVTRDRGSGARIDEAIEPGFKVCVIDLLVVAAFEVGEPGVDAASPAFEFQRIHCAPLLERADGVALGLAGIALFALLQNLSSIKASCSGVKLTLRVGIGLISLMP